MGYFIDFWNMCSIMASTKTKKCHNPHIILLLKGMRVYKEFLTAFGLGSFDNKTHVGIVS